MEGRPIRVLLLADERTVADPLLAMIEKGAENDIACEWVDDIDGEGRQLTRKEIDVVVASLPFHGCNDLGPLDKIHALAPGVPTLAITDQTNLDALLSSTPMGAGDCLVKDQLDQETIRHAIRNAFERYRFHTFLQTSQLRLEKIITNALDAILLLDSTGCVRYVNRAAEALFGRQAEQLVGSIFDFPLIRERLVDIEIAREGKDPASAEMSVMEIEWQGAQMNLVSLRDISERKAMAVSQQRTTRELKRTVRELYRVNQQVLDQQRSVIEEERLNLLVQIAGATAHKLNQPLMALLGSIDLIRINLDNQQKLVRDVDRVEAAAREIAEIVQRIQTIQRDDTTPYLRDSVIIDLDQKLKVLIIIDSDAEFDQMKTLLIRHPRIEATRARGAADGRALLEKKRYDLTMIDAALAGGSESGLLRYLFEGILDTPVVVMTGEGEEMIASHLITAGAYDYLPKSQMTEEAFSRVITNVQEKYRLQREVEGVRRQMARQSVTDSQTGLYNRRHFLEILEREMSRARRYGTVLVVGLMAPEEHPLAIAGLRDTRTDAIISMVGRLLRREIRNSDFICRYNTETIAVIFPHTDTKALGKRLEVLRRTVAEHVFVNRGEGVRLVIHIGISPFDPADDPHASVFVEKAEAALAAAKEEDEVMVIS